jgi:glycosyltransferase involved in cell wall biosynthesis
VLNTSESEGLSNALVEAMRCGALCIARRIDGNAALLTHLNTGVLFDSPAECVDVIDRAWRSKHDGDTSLDVGGIVRNARAYASAHLSELTERAAYRRLLDSMLRSRRQ